MSNKKRSNLRKTPVKKKKSKSKSKSKTRMVSTRSKSANRSTVSRSRSRSISFNRELGLKCSGLAQKFHPYTYKTTTSNTAPQKSRKTTKTLKKKSTRSKSKSVSRSRSRQASMASTGLIDHSFSGAFSGTMGPMAHLSYLSKKSTAKSKKSIKSKKSSKSRSKSKKKKIVKRKRSRSKSKSATYIDGYPLSSGPPEGRTITSNGNAYENPMSTMTPIHKILRNSFASNGKFDYENRMSTAKKSAKKV